MRTSLNILKCHLGDDINITGIPSNVNTKTLNGNTLFHLKKWDVNFRSGGENVYLETIGYDDDHQAHNIVFWSKENHLALEKFASRLILEKSTHPKAFSRRNK